MRRIGEQTAEQLSGRIELALPQIAAVLPPRRMRRVVDLRRDDREARFVGEVYRIQVSAGLNDHRVIGRHADLLHVLEGDRRRDHGRVREAYVRLKPVAEAAVEVLVAGERGHHVAGIAAAEVVGVKRLFERAAVCRQVGAHRWQRSQRQSCDFLLRD
ncbi:MAG: hypothetical protein IPM16_15520 [Chloroflexi bacterium]|nr:hypothetical protein [Chloroflexota bacterium]